MEIAEGLIGILFEVLMTLGIILIRFIIANRVVREK